MPGLVSRYAMPSSCARLTGMAEQSAAVSTRNGISAYVPYLSRTRRVTMGKGQSMPSTYRRTRRILTFMRKGGEDLAHGVIPGRRHIQDYLTALLRSDGAELPAELFTVQPAGRHDHRPVGRAEVAHVLA